MNPRAATNDLLPFQGSPFGQLGYFSKMSVYSTRCIFVHPFFTAAYPKLLSCTCVLSRKTKGSPFNSELPKRRGWDSNPRALSDKRFSRPPRYDHFDTSPYSLFFLQVKLSCLPELPKRRGWDSNPRALSDKRFSRPPRYDHFDTSPYSLFFLQVKLSCLPSRQCVF